MHFTNETFISPHKFHFMADLNPSPSKRIVELDALRALAAINLMLFHFTVVYSEKFGFTSDLGFEFPWGKYGVQLFFMLSGFVNAMTLLKKRDAKSFLVNRLLRILPIFYIVVGVNVLLLCLPPLNGVASFNMPKLLANLTAVPNLLGYACLEPVTWTLQIELLFYVLLLAMFLAGGLDRPLRTWMCYLALSLVGCLLIEPLSELSSRPTIAQLMREILLLEYVPLFIIGMLLREIRFGENGDWRTSWPHWLGIAAAAIVFHATDMHGHNPAVTLFLITTLAMAAYGKIAFLRFKPLVFISTISYSLYLLHDNLGCFFIYHMNQNGLSPLGCFVVIMPIIVALAWVSTRLLERPLSQAIKRLFETASRNLGSSNATPIAASKTNL